MSYVLMVVLMVGQTPRPVAFTQEFHSIGTCQSAADKIRKSVTQVQFIFCLEK